MWMLMVSILLKKYNFLAYFLKVIRI